MNKKIKKRERFQGCFLYVNENLSFVANDFFEKDAFVDRNCMHNAMHGDIVECKVLKKEGVFNNKKALVVISKVIDRKTNQFVGILSKNKKTKFHYIQAISKPPIRIHIKRSCFNKGKEGQMALVKINRWHYRTDISTGFIEKVFGDVGNHEVEMNVIMFDYNLPLEFPKDVENESNALSSHISRQDYKERKDLRHIPTFTIDPDEANDFDDALSIIPIEKDLFKVYVHIADVSHYVKENSKLDIEARDRATSVYLVDRTIPMLPEKISNKLCSLLPNQDKLAYTTCFTIKSNGEIVDICINKSVIHSNKRFTYNEAQSILDKKEGKFYNSLQQLNLIAKILRKKRYNDGAINFETPSVKFKLDEKGNPLGIEVTYRKDIHKLVEEFMLLTNKSISEIGFKLANENSREFIYRIHSKPNFNKLNSFNDFSTQFGYRLNFNKGIAKSINELISKIQDKPEQPVLEQLAIRSMEKAVYTTISEGHFGLALKHYTHFTSPIRRYPDLIAHRLIHSFLKESTSNGKSSNKHLANKSKGYYEQLCLHSSSQEKVASEAERASIKYKQVEYMSKQEETTFKGIISGVLEVGFFVEIPSLNCEGMVKAKDIKGDFYVFDSKRISLIGKQKKKKYTLGDSVTVSVKSINLILRTIDFVLV